VHTSFTSDDRRLTNHTLSHDSSPHPPHVPVFDKQNAPPPLEAEERATFDASAEGAPLTPAVLHGVLVAGDMVVAAGNAKATGSAATEGASVGVGDTTLHVNTVGVQPTLNLKKRKEPTRCAQGKGLNKGQVSKQSVRV